MKRSRRLSARPDALRRHHAFRPRVEQLETRNAPGEILSLAALSLWGAGLDFLADDAPGRRNLERHDPRERLSLLTRVATQTTLVSGPTGEISPGSFHTETAAGPSTWVREATPQAAEARALTDAAEFVTSFNGLEGEAAAATAGRGDDGLDARWSPQLEALLQQSLAAGGATAGRLGTDGGSVSAAPRGTNLDALQLYAAAIEPTGLGGARSGPEGLTILMAGDTNRDAQIDDFDLAGRNTWTQSSGAIYAVNFDDDDGNRQPDAVDWNDQGRPFNENKVIENEADLYDLAPLHIYPFGQGLTDNMRVYLRAASLEDVQSIHVFGAYLPGYPSLLGGVGNRAVGGAAEPLEADVTGWISRDYDAYFGVEGLLFRETNTAAAQLHRKFDGYVDLTLEVRLGPSVVGSDTVRMKVAPWIMSHHMEPSAEAWVGDYTTQNAAYRRTASADPGYVGLDASGQLQEVTGADRGTQWFQDHGEFGYTGFPGGPKTWVFFRLPYFRGGATPQPNWPKTRILRPDVGTFQIGVSHGAGAGDYGGNLEITHPYGNYLGRLILGSTGSTVLATFLQAQEVQAPVIRPNTGWLIVSHVDETFMFTQNYTEVAVASPQRAYQLMEAIPAAQRGSAVYFAKGANPVSGTATALGTATRIFTGMNHTVGTPWQWVRIYDSSATGSGAGGQMARITARGNGFLDVGTVYNTSSTVISTGVTPSHMRWALSAVAPSRVGWFNVPRVGDRFVLMQDTQLWSNGTPSAITVHEVLGDANFRTFSLNNVQNTINGQMTTLQAALGGPGSLNLVPVPALFFGTPSGGTVASRSAVAMTAGLANVIPLNTELYFPRQYGFRNTLGQDVFEQDARASFPNAVFVDDWNLYHRLLGEVHCGIVVRSDHWFPDWWTYA